MVKASVSLKSWGRAGQALPDGVGVRLHCIQSMTKPHINRVYVSPQTVTGRLPTSIVCLKPNLDSLQVKPLPPHLSKSFLSNHSYCHALSGLSDPSCWVDSTNLMTALRLRCLGGQGWRCRSWLAVLLLLGSRLCFCFVAVVLSHSPAKSWSWRGSVESNTWAQTNSVLLIHVLNQPWGVAQIKAALLSLGFNRLFC